MAKSSERKIASTNAKEDGYGPVPAERWSDLDVIFRFSCMIIIGSALLALSKDRFIELWPFEPSREYVLKVERVVLLLVVVSLVFRWLRAVSGEMRMLREYFREYIPSKPGQVFVWTILFSILLGGLGSLTDNITAFCAVFAVYSVGDIWGQHIRDRLLKVGFQSAKAKKVSDAIQRKRKAIENFYFEMPQMQRSATIMFFSFIALCMSLVGLGSTSTETKEWFDAIAYGIVIMNIVVSEGIIWHWRKTRDDILGERYSS